MAHKYKTISLFSGAMGLDIGLDQTNRFELLACVELKKAFCDTIKKNQKAGRLSEKMKVYETNIEDLDPNTVLAELGVKPGEIDLLVGGPPCQSFSTVGKRRTVLDPRGTLLWQFLHWVEVLQPKFFLMENVRGLLSAALKHRPIAERPEKGGKPLKPDEIPGSVVKAFADELMRLNGHGYHMDCFEVNAVNYGAPQLRERALFIGNRYNIAVNFPEPTHGISPDPAKQTQEKLFGNKLEPWTSLGSVIKGISEINPVIMDFSPRKKTYLSKIPQGSNWRSLPEKDQKESMGKAWFAKGGRSGWWRRLSYDLPCPTLVTMPNHASTALCHPEEVRALTVREYALIQEFPSDWEFCGTTSEQYTQIGNAVPVRLGRIAGETIAKQLDCLKKKSWKAPKHKPESYKVIYMQSHVRTRQWYKNGKTFVREDGAKNSDSAYGSPVTAKKIRRLS